MAFYIKDNFICFRAIGNSEPQDLQCIWISVANKAQEGILIEVFTRPPNQTNKHLSGMCGKKNCIVMGDFGLGLIRWKSHAASSKPSLEFLNITADNFLTQKVLHPP